MRIANAEQVIAYLAIPDGKGHRVVDPSHRQVRPVVLTQTGLQHLVATAQQPLSFYDEVGLPNHQARAESSTHLCLQCQPCSRSCVTVLARLLCRMAHAAKTGTVVVPGRRL